jgi:hypothetical protein
LRKKAQHCNPSFVFLPEMLSKTFFFVQDLNHLAGFAAALRQQWEQATTALVAVPDSFVFSASTPQCTDAQKLLPNLVTALLSCSIAFHPNLPALSTRYSPWNTAPQMGCTCMILACQQLPCHIGAIWPEPLGIFSLHCC